MKAKIVLALEMWLLCMAVYLIKQSMVLNPKFQAGEREGEGTGTANSMGEPAR